MAVKQLSDGGPQGTCLGQSASDLVGHFGSTPAAQIAYSAAMAAPTLTVLSGGSNYGFSTAAQAAAAIALIKAIRNTLIQNGLMPTS